MYILLLEPLIFCFIFIFEKMYSSYYTRNYIFFKKYNGIKIYKSDKENDDMALGFFYPYIVINMEKDFPLYKYILNNAVCHCFYYHNLISLSIEIFVFLLMIKYNYHIVIILIIYFLLNKFLTFISKLHNQIYSISLLSNEELGYVINILIKNKSINYKIFDDEPSTFLKIFIINFYVKIRN